MAEPESDTQVKSWWPSWPDARGWIGLGVFVLTAILLFMMWLDRQLREDEFFQTIATVIITNGWMSVVAWAYAATKGGGELAEKNAALVEKQAATNGAASEPLPEPPSAEEQEGLPDYAR